MKDIVFGEMIKEGLSYKKRETFEIYEFDFDVEIEVELEISDIQRNAYEKYKENHLSYETEILQSIYEYYKDMEDYEIIGYYLKRDGNTVDISKSYLLEYFYGLDTNELTIESITGNGANNILMMVTGYTEYQNQNIVTYHNKDVKHKRFYKTILKCGNKKNDINDFYWAGEGIARRNPSDFGINVVNLGDENNIPNTLLLPTALIIVSLSHPGSTIKLFLPYEKWSFHIGRFCV